MREGWKSLHPAQLCRVDWRKTKWAGAGRWEVMQNLGIKARASCLQQRWKNSDKGIDLGESSHHISTSLLCSSYCSSSPRIDWAESRTFVGCHRPQEPVTWAPASLLILNSLASRQWGKAVSVRGWPSSHCKQVVSAEPKQTENSWNKLWKTSILYLRKINFLDMSQGSDIVPAT